MVAGVQLERGWTGCASLALDCRLISKSEWPPKSPDLNPVDYHFWDSVQKMVHENSRRKSFENFAQLNRRIRYVDQTIF